MQEIVNENIIMFSKQIMESINRTSNSLLQIDNYYKTEVMTPLVMKAKMMKKVKVYVNQLYMVFQYIDCVFYLDGFPTETISTCYQYNLYCRNLMSLIERSKSELVNDYKIHFSLSENDSINEVLTLCRYIIQALEKENNTKKTYIYLSKEECEKKIEEPCAVCLETPMLYQTVTTKCNHTFCETCIQKWKTCSKNQNCPMCRTNYKKEGFICYGIKFTKPKSKSTAI